jgi:hypothetical protein
MLIPALASIASAACLATPVHGTTVKAGPFAGGLTPGYDVVDGRFRLHVGPWRVRDGLTQKIPWFISKRYPIGGPLIVTGRRLNGSPRTFRQKFNAAATSSPSTYVFPSIIAPPAPGCWRLSFASGRVTGSLVALVSDRP